MLYIHISYCWILDISYATRYVRYVCNVSHLLVITLEKLFFSFVLSVCFPTPPNSIYLYFLHNSSIWAGVHCESLFSLGRWKPCCQHRYHSNKSIYVLRPRLISKEKLTKYIWLLALRKNNLCSGRRPWEGCPSLLPPNVDFLPAPRLCVDILKHFNCLEKIYI